MSRKKRRYNSFNDRQSWIDKNPSIYTSFLLLMEIYQFGLKISNFLGSIQRQYKISGDRFQYIDSFFLRDFLLNVRIGRTYRAFAEWCEGEESEMIIACQ